MRMRLNVDLCACVEYSARAVYVRVICMALANCDWSNTGLTGYIGTCAAAFAVRRLNSKLVSCRGAMLSWW